MRTVKNYSSSYGGNKKNLGGGFGGQRGMPRGDTQGFGQQSFGANESTYNLNQGESFDH